jgi:hypothetical protein
MTSGTPLGSVAQKVLDDLQAGLKGLTISDFGLDPNVHDSPSPCPDFSVVAWQCKAAPTREAQSRFLDRKVHEDAPAPLRGVTLVREEDGGDKFYRYIDWLPLLVQLGMISAVRPASYSEYKLSTQVDLLNSVLGSEAPG